MVKNAMKVLCCLAVLGLVPTVQAHEKLKPIKLPKDVQIIPIGDQIGIQDTLLYDNSTSSGFYTAPPDGAVPVEIATGVVYGDGSTATSWHVNSFVFGYATNIPDDGTGPIEVIITFYGALAADNGPDTTSAVATFDVPGLPGVTTSNAYTVTIDLAGQGLDFDWASGVTSDGTLNLNWVSFQFQQTGTGPLLDSGAVDLNAFWSGKDLLNPPYDSGSFFYNFGGQAPPAFFLQITGM